MLARVAASGQTAVWGWRARQIAHRTSFNDWLGWIAWAEITGGSEPIVRVFNARAPGVCTSWGGGGTIAPTRMSTIATTMASTGTRSRTRYQTQVGVVSIAAPRAWRA